MEWATRAEPSGGSHSANIRLYLVPCMLLAIFLSIVTLISVAQPAGLQLGHSAQLNVAITSAALVIALGVAYFSLTEFLLYGLTSAVLIALAFLVMAESDLLNGLVPVLARWHPGSEHAGLRWSADLCWSAERCAAGALLVAAGVATRRVVRGADRPAWGVLGSIAVTAGVGTVTVLALERAGNQPGEALLPFTTGSVILFMAAAVLFWQAARETGRTWFIWLSLNLGIGTFAQLQYVFHPFQANVVQPGDILRLAFSLGILLGLIGEWGRGFRALRSQTRQLETLHALMTAPEIRDLRRVIDHVVEVVGGALNCDVYLMIPGHHISEGTDVFSLMSGADIGTDRNAVVAFNEGPGGREGYITGLLADARHLGSLAVSRPHGSPFSAADASMLRALSAQTALLLERSLLYEEVAAGAILEERSRLAREIHDGLAQHLAFLKMHVAWLQRSTGRVESQQLNSIENVLATALTEARQAITTLRVDAKATTTAEAIASYLEEFGRISDLKLFVRQDDHLPEVGPKARVELLRIVQESLNNVRKHAGATDVSVLMTTAGGRFTICVSDNGKGFDTAGNREGHFGVAIMRERAESVGGKLVVKSGSGRGTTVEVSVPVPPQPELLSG